MNISIAIDEQLHRVKVRVRVFIHFINHGSKTQMKCEVKRRRVKFCLSCFFFGHIYLSGYLFSLSIRLGLFFFYFISGTFSMFE